MEKLPISIGILSWKSGQTLVNTLQTYFQQEFLHQVNDVCILFQECSEEDKRIAEHDINITVKRLIDIFCELQVNSILEKD